MLYRKGEKDKKNYLFLFFFQALIYNGCQILVTTPRYLVRFLNENRGLLSFDRLCYLVLDNADVILNKYYKSVSETCNICINLLERLIREKIFKIF